MKEQIDRQLIDDIMWALLSVIIAALMLRVGTQSSFLTATGIFVIIVRSPPVAKLHRCCGITCATRAARATGLVARRHRARRGALRLRPQLRDAQMLAEMFRAAQNTACRSRSRSRGASTNGCFVIISRRCKEFHHRARRGVQVSFPISWLVYAAPKGWDFINFIHFLAPFVVLGIGLDDIFVFAAFFDATRPYASHFALDTRLTAALSRASGATLATSTTSAFAFAANVFSPVPAVQSFGLLLATLVITNYVLVVLWMPPVLAVYDRYILQPQLRRAAAGWSTTCCCVCLETAAAGAARKALPSATGKPAGSTPPARVLEFDRLAWPRSAVPPSHRLAAPPRYREPIRVGVDKNGGRFGNAKERVFGGVFDVIWRLRYLTIGAVLIASIVGAIGTANLEPPPTSEPPLFELSLIHI